MRSPSSTCSCAVRVREDSRLDLDELLQEERRGRIEISGDHCPGFRNLAKLVRGALQIARKATLQHRSHVHKAYRLKLESIPPRIEEGGRAARTGQWTGVIEYSEAERGCIRLIIEPKYKDFYKLYEEVVEKSPRLSQALALAVADIHLGSLGSLPAVNTAVWLIERYASRNPPYLVIEEPVQSIANIIPYGIVTKKKLTLNEKYYATLIASISMLAQMIKHINHMEQTETPLLKAMVSNYVQLQKRLVSSLVTNPRIVEALNKYWVEEPDYDTLLEIKAAARYTTPAPGAAHTAWLLLAPAPKIYEIYILLKTIEAVQQKYGGKVVPCKEDTIHCYCMKASKYRQLRIYYNWPPRKFSRFVYPMTRSRPHPDVLLAYNEKSRVVIDAKYRLAFSLVPNESGSRLELAEALRLLSYITDLARNKYLRGILAVPEKRGASDKIIKFLDGLAADIRVVEVNPQTGIKELINVL